MKNNDEQNSCCKLSNIRIRPNFTGKCVTSTLALSIDRYHQVTKVVNSWWTIIWLHHTR